MPAENSVRSDDKGLTLVASARPAAVRFGPLAWTRRPGMGVLRAVWVFFRGLLASPAALAAENLALRQ